MADLQQHVARSKCTPGWRALVFFCLVESMGRPIFERRHGGILRGKYGAAILSSTSARGGESVGEHGLTFNSYDRRDDADRCDRRRRR